MKQGRRPLSLLAVLLSVVSVVAPSVAAQSPSPDPTAAGPGPMGTPTGTQLVVFQTDVGAGNVIHVVGLDGSDAHALVPDVAGEQKHPDWSPAGDHVAFIADDDLWIADASGEGAELLLDCTQWCDYPAWSPDGASLAFTDYEPGPNAPGASNIRTIDVASKEVTDVVREQRPLLVDVPRWAPDGQSLVVGVDQMDDDGNETGAAIGIVPVTGGDVTYLTDFDMFAYYPDWSWATDTIVFSTEALGYQAEPGPGDDTWNLWTMRPDGSDLQQVTDVSAGTRLWQPSWTPDGTRIIANREEDRVGVLVDPTTGLIEELGPAMTHPRLQPAPS